MLAMAAIRAIQVSKENVQNGIKNGNGNEANLHTQMQLVQLVSCRT